MFGNLRLELLNTFVLAISWSANNYHFFNEEIIQWSEEIEEVEEIKKDDSDDAAYGIVFASVWKTLWPFIEFVFPNAAFLWVVHDILKLINSHNTDVLSTL